MSLETSIQSLLKAICPRSFPDFAPANTASPYVTWHQVGGPAPGYTDNTSPNSRGARIQVNVWSKTREEANSISLQIEGAMVSASARPAAALMATHDEDAGLRGAIQDFIVWSDR